MDPHPNIEAIRAWAEGRLGPEEVAALERAIQADPELHALAQAYGDVHRITAGALEAEAGEAMPLPDFAQLERRMAAEESTRPWRRAAAAAGVLLLTGAAIYVATRDSESEAAAPVVFQTISEGLLVEAETLDVERTLELLGSYRPVEDGKIRWVDNLADAQLMAGVTGRPMVLWGIHPTCPICANLRETTMIDEIVLDSISDYVPAQVNVMVNEHYAGIDPNEGFPVFELVDARMKLLEKFTGFVEAKDFRDYLSVGLERQGEVAALEWEFAEELVGVYERATQSEASEAYADAIFGYRELLDRGAGHALTLAGQRGLLRVARAAEVIVRRALVEEAPETMLAGAITAFEGTPYAADLEALQVAISRTGAIPDIVWR